MKTKSLQIINLIFATILYVLALAYDYSPLYNLSEIAHDAFYVFVLLLSGATGVISILCLTKNYKAYRYMNIAILIASAFMFVIS